MFSLALSLPLELQLERTTSPLQWNTVPGLKMSLSKPADTKTEPGVSLFSKDLPFLGADTRQKCHLLELPAELRENIWEYCFTERMVVWIFQINEDDEEETDGEPSLLFTCRQIRNEALPIYYTSHDFAIECKDWSASKIIQLEAKCKAMGVLKKVEIRLLIADYFEWPTIKLWSKHLHSGGTWFPEDDMGAPIMVRDCLFSGSLDIARNMQDSTWEACERVLESFFRTLEEVKANCCYPHRY